MKLLIAQGTINLGVARYIETPIHSHVPVETIFTAVRIVEALSDTRIEVQGVTTPIGVHSNA